MISILVLAGLAVVWAIVIFPDVVRWVSNNRRGDTIRTFNSQLSSLGRSNAVRDDNVIDLRDRRVAPVSGGNELRAPSRPHTHPSPRPVSPAVRKRRQDVLVALGAACLLTLLATLAFGPAFLYLHLLADVLLVGYLVLLQRVISGTAPARHSSGPATVGRVGGFAPTGTAQVRPQAMEPRRIAN